MTSSLDSLVAAILAHRQQEIDALIRQLQDGHPAAEMIRKHDAAYTALTGEAPPPWQFDPANLSDETPASTVNKTDIPSAPAAGRSPKVAVIKAVEVALDSDRDRVWNYDELVTEVESQRGAPMPGKDAKAPIRTAMWKLVKNGFAEKVGDGFRRARPEQVAPVTPLWRDASTGGP